MCPYQHSRADTGPGVTDTAQRERCPPRGERTHRVGTVKTPIDLPTSDSHARLLAEASALAKEPFQGEVGTRKSLPNDRRREAQQPSFQGLRQATAGAGLAGPGRRPGGCLPWPMRPSCRSRKEPARSRIGPLPDTGEGKRSLPERPDRRSTGTFLPNSGDCRAPQFPAPDRRPPKKPSIPDSRLVCPPVPASSRRNFHEPDRPPARRPRILPRPAEGRGGKTGGNRSSLEDRSIPVNPEPESS
jgi:hypothetical protein